MLDHNCYRVNETLQLHKKGCYDCFPFMLTIISQANSNIQRVQYFRLHSEMVIRVD